MYLISGRAGILNLDSLTPEPVSLATASDCIVHRIWTTINCDKHLKHWVWCLAQSRYSLNYSCYYQSWEICLHVGMWKMWPWVRQCSTDIGPPTGLGFAQCQGFFHPSSVRQGLLAKALSLQSQSCLTSPERNTQELKLSDHREGLPFSEPVICSRITFLAQLQRNFISWCLTHWVRTPR